MQKSEKWRKRKKISHRCLRHPKVHRFQWRIRSGPKCWGTCATSARWERRDAPTEFEIFFFQYYKRHIGSITGNIMVCGKSTQYTYHFTALSVKVVKPQGSRGDRSISRGTRNGSGIEPLLRLFEAWTCENDTWSFVFRLYSLIRAAALPPLPLKVQRSSKARVIT